MKTTDLVRAVAAAGAVWMALALPAHAAKTLTWSDAGPNRGTRAEATIWFAKELEKRTNGELKIDFHWGGTLLKAPAAAKGVGAGSADIGMVLSVYNPKELHGFSIGDLPTRYSDPWVGTRAMFDLVNSNAALQAEFDKLNLKYLTNMSSTEIQLACKGKSVRSMGDIKGLKVRGIGVYGQVFKDLGAIPVPTTVYQAYQSLDTGLIDCTQIYSYAIPAFKLQEISTDVTLLDWGALMGLAYVMNKDTWNSLSPEHQKIITQLSSEYVDHYTREMIKGNKAAIEKLRSGADGKKVNVHVFSDADKASLAESSKPYIDVWSSKSAEAGIDAAQVIQQYNALLQKYDSELRSKGYPWAR